jgi:hypothetical protein
LSLIIALKPECFLLFVQVEVIIDALVFLEFVFCIRVDEIGDVVLDLSNTIRLEGTILEHPMQDL